MRPDLEPFDSFAGINLNRNWGKERQPATKQAGELADYSNFAFTKP
jgi:hypothetical protein